MAKVTKYVHVDILDTTPEEARRLVRVYGGRVDSLYSFTGFICARIPRARLGHFKSTTTKKGVTIEVNE